MCNEHIANGDGNLYALCKHEQEIDKAEKAKEAFDYDCESMLQKEFEELQETYNNLVATHGFDDKTFIEYISENWQ